MSKTILRAALLASFGAAMLPGAAHATLIGKASETDISFNATNSTTNQAGSVANATMKTATLKQFDKNLGVLTGVNVGITSTYKQTTQVTVAAGTTGNNSDKKDRVAEGVGSSAVKLVVPNGRSGGALAQSVTDQCALTNAGPKSPCTGTASSSSMNDNISIASPDLNDYVGNSTVNANFVAVSNSASVTTTGGLTGTGTTTSTIDWSGVINAEYSYLLHAASSFSLNADQNELTLDFGNLYIGDVFGTKNFGIANRAGDRVGLQLTSILGSGDTAVFSTGLLGLFGDLGQGMSKDYTASFLGTKAGSYNATYQLTLADFGPAVHASNTLFTDYGLTLKLKAELAERELPVSEVPEPASLMLLGLGAVLAGAARRRKA